MRARFTTSSVGLVTTGRRITTIVGWSAGVCLVAYLLFVGWLYLSPDGDSDAADASGAASFWFLFASPILGGIIGVVRAVRGEPARTKVIWSLIGLVLMVVSWFVLAWIGILLLDKVLPGMD